MCCQAAVFGMVNRRHHCRFCGRVVCGKCSAHRVFHHEYHKAVRCCSDCEPKHRDSSAIGQAAATDEGSPTVVEVFECQRYLPQLLGGQSWSTDYVLASRRWQVRKPRNRTDGCFQYRQQFEATLPPGTKWVSEQWHVDETFGVNGWQYVSYMHAVSTASGGCLEWSSVWAQS
eukprot:m.267863 g.267863  ORF g.267863 m.267863 type:complete len:173 (-) comp19734_c0_seq16:295-813(-)